MPEKEQWRPVVGYESFYEVSDLGRVKRIAGGKGIVKGRILKNRPGSKGYPRVSLCRNGQPRDCQVHILVMRAFVGPPPPGHEINHKDRDRANPRLDNLEYVTPEQNRAHSLPFVRSRRIKGAHHWATLTAVQVLGIRKRRKSGVSIHRIAQEFGTTYNAIKAIVRGHSWKHLT